MPAVLNDTIRDLLRECLKDMFATSSPRSLLGPLLTVQEMLEIPADLESNRAYLDWTVAFAMDDGFRRTPPLILSLLNPKSFDPDAQALIAKVTALHQQYQRDVEAARSAAAILNPFQPVIMRRLQPVLGRKAAGTALERLARADDAAIFVVRGIRRSGRTYTTEIVNFAATQLADAGRAELWIALAEVNDDIPDRYEAVSLIASSLADNINRREAKRRRPRASPVPPLVERGPKWLHEVAQWLVDAAASTGEAWWLVLDRLASETVAAGDAGGTVPASVLKNDPVDAFIQILTRKIAKRGSDNQIRLILLGYDHDFPSEVAPAIVQEKLPPPASMGKAEVRNFFRGFFASRGGFEEAVIDNATSEVFIQLSKAGQPPSPGDFLFALHNSIKEVIGDLQRDHQ